MNPQPQQFVSVEITHSSGTQFNVSLSLEEYRLFQTDPDYGNQMAEKYYTLYQSGLLTSVEEQQQHLGEECGEDNQSTNIQIEKRVYTDEDEETLIRLVSERPPLYDFRLPLKERGRAAVKKLWQEIIDELDVDITIEALSKKWKNIRDSFIRVRGNIKKKLASGSSADEKVQGERLQRSHKNYELLMFLEDSLAFRKTSTNLETEETDGLRSPLVETPSTSRSASRTSIREDELSIHDKVFLEAVKNLPAAQPAHAHSSFTDTQFFCMRLAAGLDRLPSNMKNQLECEFLGRLTEMENKYATQ